MESLRILSVENSLSWSWSFALLSLKRALDCYRFVRIQRVPKYNIAPDLIDFFDVILLQNVDTLKLIDDNDSDNFKKVITRMGDIATDKSKHGEQLKKVGAVVSTNKELHKVAESYNKNAYMIPNGIDLDLFKPLPVNPYAKSKPFTIGFAGNIHGAGQDYKGWNIYSSVLNSLYYCDHVEALFNHNQISHDKMPERFYHKLDCIILPSKGEGCSNVTMEALACGVPVLITKVGFHGEFLKHGQNCLFIERTEQSIIDAVNKLINDKELHKRLCNAGRAFAEEYHDINTIAGMYDKVIKSVLSRNKKFDMRQPRTVSSTKSVKKNRNKFDRK